jgi:hypothetical protein
MSPSSGRVELAFAPSNATGSCFPTAVFAEPRRSPEFRLRGENLTVLLRTCIKAPGGAGTNTGHTGTRITHLHIE